MRDTFAERRGVALVTGGTGGLGRAIVELLVARGSAVVFTYHQDHEGARAIEAWANSAGGHVRGERCDLSDATAAAAFAGSLGSREGIHTVIHAAGPLVRQRHLSATSGDEFARSLAIELTGVFGIVTGAIPALRASKGSVVAVTSAATSRAAARDGLSAIPKGGVEQLVRTIAAEEGRYGVRANAVGPGMLTSGMAADLVAAGDLDERALDAARSNIAMRRFGDAADIAEAVCFLASERARYISGQILNVDGGYSC